jgi:DNA-binding transcriptional regulator YiaG
MRAMPSFVTALKEEIRRLARREVNSVLAKLRKASAQYRRDVALLKREAAAAKRRLALLESQRRRERRLASGDVKKKRFSPRAVRAHRNRLGLSAAEYGKLVGVSGNTVYLWELGKARPRAGAFTQWVDVRALGKRAALARLQGV